MSSRTRQRLLGLLALLAIILLFALLGWLWGAVHAGVFSESTPKPVTVEPALYELTSPATERNGERSLEEGGKRDAGERSRRPLNSPFQEAEVVKPFKLSDQKLHEHDLIYHPPPVNNSSSAPPLRHSGHYRQVKAHFWDPHPQYTFTAFGRRFHLLLQLDSTFVAPNLQVLHVWKNHSRKEEPSLRADGCFYKGTVAGEPGSLVALNLCHGMKGLIRTSDANYFIQPVEPSADPTHPREHIISREAKEHGSAPWPNLTVPPQQCGSPDVMVDGFERTEVISEPTEETEAWSGEDQVHHREKRQSIRHHSTGDSKSLNEVQEYFIEIMVVADHSMVEYHGEHLDDYLLTLMHTVSQIFKDASIGNSLRLAVVNLTASHDPNMINLQYFESIDGYNASKMLEEFCQWQFHQNRREDSDPLHHDTAILLTRQNICQSKELCDMLGLAEVGHVCHPELSCSIVLDNGLSSAFTIAHELGHVLSMPHDDDEHKCSGGDENHIMSRQLDKTTKPWTWSNCSRQFITEFLDLGRGECLRDPPGKDFIEPQAPLAGEYFSVDRQCELMFGNSSQKCNQPQKECEHLWCQKPSELCRSKGVPWADGTPCNDVSGGWCQRGECVKREPNSREAINGSWSSWLPYSDCSRTCGGGIQTRQRLCNSPSPSNGGRYCQGVRVEFKSCNTKPCDHGTPGFREVQCAEFNGNIYSNSYIPKNVRWVPKYGLHGDERCKLSCRVETGYDYYFLREKVQDGTPCGPDTFDVCVGGKCHQAGCDHQAGSQMKLDRCGICGGDNTACQQVRGKYMIQSLRVMYTRVVHIPKGSLQIDIRNYRPRPNDTNYMALVDNATGDYLFNGNSILTRYQTRKKFNGVMFEHSGLNTSVERINATGPILRDLFLEVLSTAPIRQPNITYEFLVPLNVLDVYRWKLTSKWSTCDKVCNGESKREIICTRRETGETVPDEYCRILDPPDNLTKECNTLCQLRWQLWAEKPCSAHCGSGTREVVYVCMRVLKSDATDMNDIYCQHLPRPNKIQKCYGSCQPAHWEYGVWSKCSATCGTGVQTRQAKCVNNDGEVRDDSECLREDKYVKKTCHEMTCATWARGVWSPCSTTCGYGNRVQSFWCQIDNQIVPKEYCSSPEPQVIEDCFVNCNVWYTHPWTQCSVSCGRGVEIREIECHSIEGQEVSENQCDNAQRPETERNCSRPACVRPTTYPPETDDNTIPKLSDHERINNERTTAPDDQGNGIYIYDPDRPRWVAHEWEECSVTCGKGYRKREVQCRYKGVLFTLSNCEWMSIKPRTWEHCSFPSCEEISSAPEPNDSTPSSQESSAIWMKGGWGQCSTTCGQGIRQRMVECQDEEGRPSNQCDHSERPTSEEACDKGPCAYWRFDPWQKCSAPCERWGLKKRKVYCVSGDNHQPVSDDMCASRKRPSDATECAGSCNHHKPEKRFYWKKGPWSQCSRSCGPGVRRRAVACVSHAADGAEAVVEPSRCHHTHRPRDSRDCRRNRCPFGWLPGSWAECSTRCGRGVKRRTFACFRILSREKSEKLARSEWHRCPGDRPPDEEGPCEGTECSEITYELVAGPWQPCTQPCGKRGKQNRRMTCQSVRDKVVVSREYCKGVRKLPRRRACNRKRCDLTNNEFRTCQEVRRRLKTTVDTEYMLNIHGKPISIYCHNMTSTKPLEYLTLKERNFAEFYDKMLYHPDTCPYKAERNESCYCQIEVKYSGLTVFHKVRLILSTLGVDTRDFTFSKQIKGHQVAYGEAGDCYSKVNCPQSRFEVNLEGTGFRVSPETKWTVLGSEAVKSISRLNDDIKVVGKCGGYCGQCSPMGRGFRLQLL